MAIYTDSWLADILGCAVFKVEVALPEAAQELADHAASQEAAMYYAKVDTGNVALARELSAAGMYVVDVNVTFSLEQPKSHTVLIPAHIQVEDARPEYYEDILAIAGSCFRYSRFHLDPLISDEMAHRIKYEWIKSYTRGLRGEKLLMALVDNRPAGFLAVLASEQAGQHNRIIDLIGVGAEFQNQGVGKALVNEFVQRYRDESTFLQVGTQAANIPSMRLYAGFGFAITTTTYVLHMHVHKKSR